MYKTLTTLLALSLCLAAGCGGGDDSSRDSAKAPAETEKAAAAKPASSSGEVPSYAEVKKEALKDPTVAKLCADGGQDSKIGVSAKGETYRRLICDRNREVLDYVVGRKGYAENYESSVDLSTHDLWKLGSEAFVKPGDTSGVKGLAQALKALCGCGEVVPGGYGS